MALVIVGICVLVMLTVWILGGIRIVRPFELGVVERLGRFRATLDPGLRRMRPLFDRMHRIDMREQLLEQASSCVMTKDGVAVDADTAVFYAAVQPEAILYDVADFRQGLVTLAQTGVRTAVGEVTLDDALTAPADIGLRLRALLADATRAWGIEVRRVEVSLEAPAELVAAMVGQTAAKRTRIALVAQADGERRAAIARADGERRVAELKAEGKRAARRIAAESDAEAIRILYEAIKGCRLHPNDVAARSVEVLRELATTGAALTVVLPSGASPYAAVGSVPSSPWSTPPTAPPLAPPAPPPPLAPPAPPAPAAPQGA